MAALRLQQTGLVAQQLQDERQGVLSHRPVVERAPRTNGHFGGKSRRQHRIRPSSQRLHQAQMGQLHHRRTQIRRRVAPCHQYLGAGVRRCKGRSHVIGGVGMSNIMWEC